MNDVMIDLETLGTSPDSIILSLGAVKFDLASNAMSDEAFYNTIDIDDQFRLGRTISGSTISWWMDQSKEAQSVFREPPELLNVVLENFAKWIAKKNYVVWSNGADFDLPMLAHAYHSLGMKVPWKYSDTRCFRTLKSLPGAAAAKLPMRQGLHNALSDAVWQAQAAQAYHLTLFKK